MKFWYFIFLFFIVLPGFGQSINCSKPDFYERNFRLDSCNCKLCRFSEINETIKKSILVAFSYFPELSETNIVFKYSKIKTTANARPTIASVIFNSKHNRRYIIRINNSNSDSVISLDDTPFEALVGLFAHELCHISDYNKRNIFGILRRLHAYLREVNKSKFEKEIDSMVIRHGLGCALYQWSNFIIHSPNVTMRYKQFKQRVYLKPEEIQLLINSN